MYDFAFYFLFKMLSRKKDDAVFISTLGVAIIISLHILAVAILLGYFQLIPKIPVFSNTYLYNKLYWYTPALMVIGIAFLYFTKTRVQTVFAKYSSSGNFYSNLNILLLLLIILTPAIIIARLK